MSAAPLKRIYLRMSASSVPFPHAPAREKWDTRLISLEVELNRQLHLSRADRGVPNLTEAGIVYGRVGRAEHRVVERILRLDAELEVHLLAHLELLSQGQVRGKRPRGPHPSVGTRRVSQSEGCRFLQHAVVHEVVKHPVGAVIPPWRSYHIGPLRAIGWQGDSVRKTKRQRPSVGDSPNAVRLPSAYDPIRPAWHISEECPPAPERQIIAVAELRHVRNVECRQASFQPRLVRIL